MYLFGLCIFAVYQQTEQILPSLLHVSFLFHRQLQFLTTLNGLNMVEDFDSYCTGIVQNFFPDCIELRSLCFRAGYLPSEHR